MMKNTLFFILIAIHHLATANSSTLTPFYETYDWDSTSIHLLTDEIRQKPIAEIKNKIVEEFFYNQSDMLVEYEIEHKAYWLNSDEEIENYNKIYLPYSQSSNILVSKARVIKGNGEIIVLDETKIMTAKNEETGREYKYFAFEGVEKGSIVEYLFITESMPHYTGTRITLQNGNDKYNVEFDLYTPENLIFAFKSFNGLDTVHRDTLIEDKLHWSLQLPYIEKLEDEDFSAYHANKQYLIYKLDYNKASGDRNIISYANTAKDIFEYYHAEISKKEKKAIKKLLAQTDVDIARDYIGKIRAIEDFVKNNYYVIENYSPELSELSTILNEKIGNERGIIKLYIAMFQEKEIAYQLVLTTDRFDLKFDPEFEANNYLTDYLIYFPKIDEFLSPNGGASRVGFPNPEFTECYGLFIKQVKLGDFISGVGKVKYIKGVDYKKTFDHILVDVDFDKEDMTKTLLKIDRSSGGYYIRGIQPYMHILKDKDETLEELITFINEDLEIKDKTVYNDDSKFFGIEPLRIVANAESTDFVEKAGKNYLFKVGELIGPQHEMYEEKERKQDVEITYRKDYHREIKVNIPEGYIVKNLNDININETFDLDGKEIMKFESSYTIDGNTLTIVADEYYNFIRLDKKYFNDYRRVMNGAADFNKVTLVLEKQ